MGELFRDIEPAEVKNLIEEMFEGYIDSDTCDISQLPMIYLLKNRIVKIADNKLRKISRREK